MNIQNILLSNYLPYAKGTIIGRAIPSIDGLKPAQRRILYTMYRMGLINGSKTKSSNIVGQSMKIHPHGDMSIYESVVRMTVGNEALNAPYIDSKGNFGKVYSSDLAFAAPRYTEAKLMPICKEVFDGMDEDAVEMIDNFDSTTTEPTLLPVKFPSILVNPSNGIAVGMSSSIPSFSLVNACKATIGILKGEINDAGELMDVLGVPEFSTGGYIHADKATLRALGETGKGSFIMSGVVERYSDRIIINEIPYRTTAEAIVEAVEENIKNGNLKEVSHVSDEIDIKGFRLVVMLKARSNVSEVLRKLCRLTPLRMSINFNTRVIINNRCEEIGLLELLNKWIGFRTSTISRIYNSRFKKAAEDEYLLSSWEKIKGDIAGALTIISKGEEEIVRTSLMSKYGLSEKQANYLLDMKLRMITLDNMRKKLADLDKTRANMVEYKKVIDSDQEKYKIIVDDLSRIITSYGSANRTHQTDLIVETATPIEEAKVDDRTVVVITTKSGYIKRLTSTNDIASYVLPEGEEEQHRWAVKNNEDILVFTHDGTVHKVLVDSIDASRGTLKDELYKLAGLTNKKEILFVDAAGDYSKYFNLVYPNGRGTRVYYNKAKGARRKYKSLFDECEVGKVWITFADQFFMITAKRKAAYCNLELMGILSSRVAFKVARVNRGDFIWGLQPVENVPDIDSVDLDKYRKDYTVCINEDILWEGAGKQATEETEETDGEDSVVE